MIDSNLDNSGRESTPILIQDASDSQNLLNEENLIHKKYLNNSYKETDGSTTTLTMAILDADRNFAKLFKQKIDDTMVNNKTRYPKCDIMYSYTIYPEVGN